MLLKQLSVFMENRQGRVEEITKTLADHQINITTFSLADTSEYGLLRMIVETPEEGKNVLKEAGFSAVLTEVIAVRLPHEVGALYRIMETLKDVNIEYIYVLSTGDNPSLIIKADNATEAISALKKDGFSLLGEEAYRINTK